MPENIRREMPKLKPSIAIDVMVNFLNRDHDFEKHLPEIRGHFQNLEQSLANNENPEIAFLLSKIKAQLNESDNPTHVDHVAQRRNQIISDLAELKNKLS